MRSVIRLLIFVCAIGLIPSIANAECINIPYDQKNQNPLDTYALCDVAPQPERPFERTFDNFDSQRQIYWTRIFEVAQRCVQGDAYQVTVSAYDFQPIVEAYYADYTLIAQGYAGRTTDAAGFPMLTSEFVFRCPVTVSGIPVLLITHAPKQLSDSAKFHIFSTLWRGMGPSRPSQGSGAVCPPGYRPVDQMLGQTGCEKI